MLDPEAGGDEGPGDLGEVVLQPGRAVLRQTLQSVYSEQFDLSEQLRRESYCQFPRIYLQIVNL